MFYSTTTRTQWCLDTVLNFVKSDRFSINLSLEDLKMKVVFLVGLGVRISELHSLLRGSNFIKFDDAFYSVTLFPNPEFLAKTESASNRGKPIIIKSFRLCSGHHHCLCPVSALQSYLRATKHMKQKLFINPSSLLPCTSLAVVGLLRKLVKASQLGIYCAFHGLRKFAHRYLAKSLKSRGPCIALGLLCCNLVGSLWFGYDISNVWSFVDGEFPPPL